MSIKDHLWTTIENSNHIFIGSIVGDQAFDTSYPYKVYSTPFSLIWVFVIVKVESGYWYEVAGVNPVVDFNSFENHYMHILTPPNIEIFEPELKMISNKYQYKDKFTLNSSISDEKWNQITGFIKETCSPLMVQLYDGTCMYYRPLPLLEDNNSIEPLQKGGRGYGWFAAKDTSCTNS